MNVHHPDPIWLIIPVLAVSFLLWVLWNFWKDGRKQHEAERAAEPCLLVSTSAYERSRSFADVRNLYPAGRAMSHTTEREARG
jgi:hypothetical protein